MELKTKEKYINSLMIAALAAFTLFLFGPSQIYLPNSPMFSYPYKEVVLKFLPDVAIMWLFLAVVMFIFPLKFGLHKKVAVFILAGTALLWVQGNILVWKYGVLDGKDIHWSEHTYKGIVDGVTWLVVLIAAFFASSFVYRHARRIVVVLFLAQVLSIGVLFFQNPEAHVGKQYALFDTANQYDFSSKRNVFIVIVDGFQSDLFQEITGEDDKYKKMFDGFTYFRNALAGFPLTLPSVPFILTGQRFDNSIPFPQYIDSVYFSSSSVLKVLKENGFRVDISMDCGRCFNRDKRLISNLKMDTVSISNRQAGYLFDLTLFRYLPHYLKKVIYNNQQWRFARYFRDENEKDEALRLSRQYPQISGKFSLQAIRDLDDIRFVTALLAEARATSQQDVFKFYHFKGIHPPFRMNEQLQYEIMKTNRHNWKRLGKGALELVNLFIEELKKQKVFDQSLIFIIGDHGHSIGELGLVVPPSMGKNSRNYTRVPKGVLESALPMILVKPIGAVGEMQVSDAPVSLGDIPHTLFSLLGIQGDFAGESMFSLDPKAVRTRRFSFFIWDRAQGGLEFLPSLQEYNVTGHSWFEENWQSVPSASPKF